MFYNEHKKNVPVKKKPVRQPAKLLLNELSLLIEQSQRQAYSAANSLLVVTFWQVGKRINEHILQNKRADLWKGDCRDSVTTIAKKILQQL